MTNPASQLDQYVRRFAKPEVAAPAPHIRSQLGHHLVQARALGVSGDLSNPFLKPFDSLRRDLAPNFRLGRETESEKFPLLRSRYRALCLVHLELEPACDEAFNALHHRFSRPL